MTTKSAGAGSEVDSYCTKCKLDLNHRVIAMDGDKVVRVECLTCRGHHNYRLPKSAAKPKAPRKKAATRKKAAAPKVEDHRKFWEEAIMGRVPEDFTNYRIDTVLERGELVAHKKFGDGVVSELQEDGKVQIVFEAGPKTLVHGRSL